MYQPCLRYQQKLYIVDEPEYPAGRLDMKIRTRLAHDLHPVGVVQYGPQSCQSGLWSILEAQWFYEMFVIGGQAGYAIGASRTGIEGGYPVRTGRTGYRNGEQYAREMPHHG